MRTFINPGAYRPVESVFVKTAYMSDPQVGNTVKQGLTAEVPTDPNINPVAGGSSVTKPVNPVGQMGDGNPVAQVAEENRKDDEDAAYSAGQRHPLEGLASVVKAAQKRPVQIEKADFDRLIAKRKKEVEERKEEGEEEAKPRQSGGGARLRKYDVDRLRKYDWDNDASDSDMDDVREVEYSDEDDFDLIH